MRLDIRNIIRFTLVVTTVAYLLDAGVEASKNRKKKNRNRSKRTHGDKPHRHKKYPKEEMGGRVTEPNVRRSAILVEKQRKHKRVHTASWVRNEEYEAGDSESRFNLYMPHTRGGFSPDVYEKILKEKQQMMFQQNDETTMLPVVEAMLEFYVKPTRNEKFYSPSTTTTTNAISSAEPGLSPPFRTTYGRYGLHTLADKTVFGKVIHISDAGRTNSHFGCGEAIANLYEIPENQEPWIALIERGHCSFFIKIKLAERNNASAVIFYDNKDREVPRINTIGKCRHKISLFNKIVEFLSADSDSAKFYSPEWWD